MTQANIELLNALREAGASDAASEAAAWSVAAFDQVATKADLAELRSWLLWRMALIAGVCVAVSERLSRT